jgi:hypothetical protein
MKTQETTIAVINLARVFFNTARTKDENTTIQFSIGRPPVSGIDKATLDLPK